MTHPAHSFRLLSALAVSASLILTAACSNSGGDDTAPVAVTGITLNVSDTVLQPEETLTLAPAVLPANADDLSVAWTSSNPSVAPVDGGTVTAVAAGSTTITATTADGDYTAACTVTVNALPFTLCGVEVAAADLPGNYTWYTATTACPPGWRLPTLAELKCIAGHRATVGGFATANDLYWSSNVYNDCYAYTVWYSNGMVEELRPTMDYAKGFVRCVR